ncbi:NET1-associated nuclear protein 1 (U3 small nucleolar RNA-associated protein 17) [Geosmithia morbida]|uniref:NET1-associated nuclear protein 1 (U3 small nucleolar RNA-associated protein 17) n=1 Tax=Geosmithia morbida TaxID=1094350 RepID=A0A9P4Z0G2_9HYPO|nr:NET1-associated nuclear protein 1 (U3 small nucleolar RNA-associated protein 17) [Geosmithia morbida]KAF4125154.1 NET1-associated nuclear protein 1 (U3 small nucleolar RNA-associated protein 17) [Geosmithia morbida]
MAGNRRSADDKIKKRKRDLNDADAKSKRHRKINGAVEKIQDANDASATLEEVGLRHLDLVKPTRTDSEAGWRVSKPMGGRMLDIDPILTDDEQYLIIAYNTSIQVYAASDSLLVRRIPISTADSKAPNDSSTSNAKPAVIISMRLSKKSPDSVWVATSDGRVFHVNWTGTLTGTPDTSFRTNSKTARAMVVMTIGDGGNGGGSASKKPSVAGAAGSAHDVVLVVESDKSARLEITAYLPSERDGNKKPRSRSLFSIKKGGGSGLQLLESANAGRVLVGALHDRVFLGAATFAGSADGLDQLRYDFFSFDTPDIVTSIDVRARAVSGKRARSSDANQVVDVLVGGARGSIYLYHDAVNRLQAVGRGSSDKEPIQAQKYHWHRKAVHSVKWSRDGNYMISGGSENVLVMWQMDTSKKDFLPHLSGSVENIVVSRSGASYTVHLDDNSTMIISTAEMKPTAYVSGIQSAAVNVTVPKDLLVRRLWTSPEHVRRVVPAAIRPSDPSKLHVCVGGGQQATTSGDYSAPLLQSFDLETFTSVMKQPLARTQPTDNNLSNRGYPIDEPLVTHVAFSADGKWLASVDDWKPAERDVDNVSGDLRDQLVRERREVHLKFWEMGASGATGDGDQTAALVSRINAPHATGHPEAVLDLAAAPSSACFATIGGDGAVRVWRPRVRRSGGIVARGPDGRDLYSWGCSQVIAVGDGLGQDAAVDPVSSAGTASSAGPQGSIAFSEDGSTMFAAFGGVDAGVVHVIDAASGEVVKTLQDLWTGRLRSIETLSSSLVVLSDELIVYDVVGDELRYGIAIPPAAAAAAADGIPGGADLVQLKVDHRSGHFAVSLPLGEVSSIGIFDPQDPEPLLVRSVPHRIVSLVAAPDTSGFMALDDAAQIWTVTEESDPSSLVAVQPLEDLRLDGPATTHPGSSVGALLGNEEGDAEMGSDDDDDDDDDDEGGAVVETEDTHMADDDDDHVHASVVAQQHLSDIFDAAPAFAGPSIEDMFYKVTGLLGGSKPLVPAE